ncbi:MAG: helix-turn-helix domain-containing protein [Patescibacteria group bacterium]
MQEPKKYLSDLGLSDSEVVVYLAMVSGVRTARDLVKVTRLKRPTVYYALGCLEKRGLTSKTGLAGDKNFALEPLQKLAVIANEKVLEVSKLEANIKEMIPGMASLVSTTKNKPVVAFYEGADAVKNTIMEMLYCKSKAIKSIVPKDNFFWQIGQDFVELFIEERKRRNIKTKNLWESPIDTKLIKQYYEGFSDIRILPSVMLGKFNTIIFVYDDKTLYVSSKNNSYCVLITSKEHADTMSAIFEGLWCGSTPHAKNK